VAPPLPHSRATWHRHFLTPERRGTAIHFMWYFYVLQSLKDPQYFYKGSTNNLPKRIEQHNKGTVTSTKPYGPFRLVYYEAYLREHGARMRESSVKKSGSVSVPLMRRIRESL
jgi:putative endonuclease